MSSKIIYLEDNGVVLKFSGILSWKDIHDANEKIYATSEKIRSIHYQIADFTDVERTDITSAQVRKLAEQDANAARINPDMILAIVGSDDLIYGLARMWEAYASDASFEKAVFRYLDDAKKWINQKVSAIHDNKAV